MKFDKWVNIIDSHIDGEIWKPVPGFNQTEASSYGRVRTTDRWVKTGKGGVRFVCGKIKSQALGKDGYLRVDAALNGVCKKVTAHRICALAFCPNPMTKKTVQHFNDIKHCNEYWNLGWFTQGEQVRDAIKKGRLLPGRHGNSVRGKSHYNYGKRARNAKYVIQCDIDGNEIKKWDSIKEVMRKLNIYNVSACIRGLQKTSGGFTWKVS